MLGFKATGFMIQGISLKVSVLGKGINGAFFRAYFQGELFMMSVSGASNDSG